MVQRKKHGLWFGGSTDGSNRWFPSEQCHEHFRAWTPDIFDDRRINPILYTIIYIIIYFCILLYIIYTYVYIILLNNIYIIYVYIIIYIYKQINTLLVICPRPIISPLYPHYNSHSIRKFPPGALPLAMPRSPTRGPYRAQSGALSAEAMTWALWDYGQKSHGVQRFNNFLSLLWVKQCHEPSPSHHHFDRWYGYHAQSWVVKMALF